MLAQRFGGMPAGADPGQGLHETAAALQALKAPTFHHQLDRRAKAAQVLYAAPVAPLAVQLGTSTARARAGILLGFDNGPQGGLALRPDHPVASQSYPSSNWGHGDHSLRAVSCPQSLMKSLLQET